MDKRKQYQIKLDSHVHFYDNWDISLNQLLTSAYANLTLGNAALPVICLLDTGKEAISVTQQLAKPMAGEWQKHIAELEPYSFWFKKQEKTILVITGTQINTIEGLEVLVIGNRGDVTHDMPIEILLEQQRDGLLNVIPWAAGKWLSKRGKILTQLLKTMKPHQFVLGDNAGRPWLWTGINQLEYAKTHNIPILCGSDPLPLHNHYLKSGTYGNLLNINMDTKRPWTSIIQAIHHQTQSNQFGHLSSIPSFVMNQLKLRLPSL
ncbi:MAG: hypothetical protein JKX75_01620 [Gammaproteobacteria bacterium]|nr:hypothetical protein [Gammaproteobacteria bacterium]